MVRREVVQAREGALKPLFQEFVLQSYPVHQPHQFPYPYYRVF